MSKVGKQAKPTLVALAQQVDRRSKAGRPNLNDGMGPAFVRDVETMIAAEMEREVGNRLSVAAMYRLVLQAYPHYPNKYSAFAAWVGDRFDYPPGRAQQSPKVPVE
jgi:hypothetical protein